MPEFGWRGDQAAFCPRALTTSTAPGEFDPLNAFGQLIFTSQPTPCFAAAMTSSNIINLFMSQLGASRERCRCGRLLGFNLSRRRRIESSGVQKRKITDQKRLWPGEGRTATAAPGQNRLPRQDDAVVLTVLAVEE